MTVTELQWLIGTALTFLLAVGGMVIASFRSLSGKIDKGNEELARGMKQGDDALHERVNRVRDEYVRRVDMDGHMARIDETLRELRDEARETNRVVLAAIGGRRSAR